MLNLISCELLKLKRSKMVLISVAGVLSTPLLMLIEALQTHFDKPEIIFTLSDIYSDSVLYIMLLVNIMIYVAIAIWEDFKRLLTDNQPITCDRLQPFANINVHEKTKKTRKESEYMKKHIPPTLLSNIYFLSVFVYSSFFRRFPYTQAQAPPMS